jgi:hypothetical protein
MLNFGRGKLVSTISIHEDDSDSVSVTSKATRRTASKALCLPKNLEDVYRSQHGNLPKNLPGDDASQEEVRYYIYSVLTCKDNISAKAYPQWVLETCMSWEGTGKRLRNLSEEELQILCPLRAGYAEINPSREHKLEDLPLPAARQTIGAAIARAVGASRLADSRKVSMHQDWNGVIHRPNRRYEPTDDSWRHVGCVQLSEPSQIFPENSSPNVPGSESPHHSGSRIFFPTLPDVHESQNEDYFQRQNLALRPRPTPLPRHLGNAQYAGSTDSSSIESPVVDSILSQDSNSTSQTSLGGLETARDSCSSPMVNRRFSCASPIASTKQQVPRYEHKETLAELEASSTEMSPDQGPLHLGRRPRRYRVASGFCSYPKTRSNTSLQRDSKQFDQTRRPSEEFDQYQNIQPWQQTSQYGNIIPVRESYHEPCLQVASPDHELRRISFSSPSRGQLNHQSVFCNPDRLGNHALSTSRSLPFINNRRPIPIHAKQGFSGEELLPSMDLLRGSEALQFQQQEKISFSPLSGNGSRISQIRAASQATWRPKASLNNTLSPRLSHADLTSFQTAQNDCTARHPRRSNMSVRSAPNVAPRGLGLMYPVADISQAQRPPRPVSVAPRAASNHRMDSFAFDQADFHVWKGNLLAEQTLTANHERPQLAKSQSDNLVQRAREQQLRAAWNIDLYGRKGSAGPSLRYLDPATGQPRKTFYEAIEEREIMDGKPQRGVDRGLANNRRRYH